MQKTASHFEKPPLAALYELNCYIAKQYPSILRKSEKRQLLRLSSISALTSHISLHSPEGSVSKRCEDVLRLFAAHPENANHLMKEYRRAVKEGQRL